MRIAFEVQASMSSRNHFSRPEPDVKIAAGQIGTGQIGEKKKEDENGIGIRGCRKFEFGGRRGGRGVANNRVWDNFSGGEDGIAAVILSSRSPLPSRMERPLGPESDKRRDGGRVP